MRRPGLNVREVGTSVIWCEAGSGRFRPKTDDRLGCTILSDEVNLAARLTSLNKDCGSKILIGARTRGLAGVGFDVTELGQVTVHGRARPVMVYKVGD